MLMRSANFLVRYSLVWKRLWPHSEHWTTCARSMTQRLRVDQNTKEGQPHWQGLTSSLSKTPFLFINFYPRSQANGTSLSSVPKSGPTGPADLRRCSLIACLSSALEKDCL